MEGWQAILICLFYSVGILSWWVFIFYVIKKEKMDINTEVDLNKAFLLGFLWPGAYLFTLLLLLYRWLEYDTR